MKLPAYKAAAWLAAPLPANVRAVLLYGRNLGALSLARQRLTHAWLGEDADPLAAIELDEARLAAEPALLAEEAGGPAPPPGRRCPPKRRPPAPCSATRNLCWCG